MRFLECLKSAGKILASKIHHKTEFWTQLTVSQWNASGIFPRIHDTAAPPRSPKVHEQKQANPDQFHRTNYTYVGVQ